MKHILTILLLLLSTWGFSQAPYSHSDDFNIVHDSYELSLSAIRFEKAYYKIKHQDSTLSFIDGNKIYGLHKETSKNTILNFGHILIKDSINYSPYKYSLDVGGMLNPWGDFFPKISVKFFDTYIEIKGMFGDETKPYYVIWIITKDSSERVLITDDKFKFYTFKKE